MTKQKSAPIPKNTRKNRLPNIRPPIPPDRFAFTRTEFMRCEDATANRPKLPFQESTDFVSAWVAKRTAPCFANLHKNQGQIVGDATLAREQRGYLLTPIRPNKK